jgi:hypothetical protein
LERGRLTSIKIQNRFTCIFSDSACLIDIGAFRNYIDLLIVLSFKLEQCDHPNPYYLVGANGKELNKITKQACTLVAFDNNHFEYILCNVMPLGGLNTILGHDWLKICKMLLPE